MSDTGLCTETRPALPAFVALREVSLRGFDTDRTTSQPRSHYHSATQPKSPKTNFAQLEISRTY